MFAAFVLNNHVRGNGLTDIVQNPSCIDFLLKAIPHNSLAAEARRWTEPVWQLSDHPRHPFGPPLIGLYRVKRQQVAAALSAAVTTTKPIRDCPYSQAEPTMQKRTPPNASRSSGEGGLGGEGLLSEKPPLPPESPQRNLFGREHEGGGFSTEKPPPSQNTQDLIAPLE